MITEELNVLTQRMAHWIVGGLLYQFAFVLEIHLYVGRILVWNSI